MSDHMITSHPFINSQCVVLTNHIETSKLKKLVKDSSQTVFIVENNKPFIVTASENNNELTYTACGEVSVDAHMTHIVNAFKENHTLLVKDK
ncbi:MAG TPA: hypothetical protein VK077_08995, partial [Virgibacillus sp.]|nr:hypothetical protein [Virgibacillus sp.]